MRLELIALLTFSTLTIACCGNKSFKSCCGNGKCNIFCCNCDGGCNKSCQAIKLPICWAWQGGTICDNPDGSTSMSGGGPKVPPKPGKLAAVAPTLQQENVAVTGEAMGEKPAEVNATQGGIKIQRVTEHGILEDDHSMHQAVDGHGKGFFTYNEFLKYMGEQDGPDVQEYFNKYDRNGDGVITPDEMRLAD